MGLISCNSYSFVQRGVGTDGSTQYFNNSGKSTSSTPGDEPNTRCPLAIPEGHPSARIHDERNELDEETRQGQETPTLCPVHPHIGPSGGTDMTAVGYVDDATRIRSSVYAPKACADRTPRWVPPVGVRLLAWTPKAPPILLTQCSVVGAPGTFIVTTLQQSHERGACEAAVGGRAAIGSAR